MKRLTSAFVSNAWLFIKVTTVGFNRSMFRQLSGSILLWLLLSSTAQAQIVPDATLGGERSTLVPRAAGGDSIRGGSIRGSNLFHSFSDFNVGTGQQVYFANPTGIQNILTRVTGGNASNINGTLGVDGTANLFLINPNGILFGQTARLDVRGSFLATTANAIGFGTQGSFSATNPGSVPLLTVQPSALLYTQIGGGGIVSQSLDLEVPRGQSLLLVGGDVKQNGGLIGVLDGRVELGGLAAPGSISLNQTGTTWSLGFPNGVARSNVSLSNSSSNDSFVTVSGNGGGSIGITAKDFAISGNVYVFSGIGQGQGAIGARGGDITIDATDAVTLSQGSNINSLVQTNAIGDAGNIVIKTGSLLVQDGSLIASFHSGQGNSGNISITARNNVTLSGANDNNSSGISTFADGGQGNTGSVQISTGSLLVKDGAQLDTLINRPGNSGNITINARDAVVVDGAKERSPSAIATSLYGVGNGGDIQINTGTFTVSNGGSLASGLFGRGNAGNIIIFHSFSDFNIGTGQQVYFASPTGIQNILARVTGKTASTIDGVLGVDGSANLFLLNPNGILFGQAAQLDVRGSFVGSTANGMQFGNQGEFSATNPQAPSLLTVQPSALLFTQLNAGKIRSESIAPVDQMQSGLSVPAGQSLRLIGGDVEIDGGYQGAGLSAQGGQIELGGLAGTGTIALSPTGLQYSQNSVRSNVSLLNDAVVRVSGANSSIAINANQFAALDGSRLITETAGIGDSGDVVLNARQVLLQGAGFDPAQGLIRSGILTGVEPGAIGNAGTIRIATDALSIADGGTISTVTRGQGNAGNIVIDARDRVTVNNLSDINSSIDPTGIGQGGTIQIRTPRLSLSNEGLITSVTTGQGNAGNIEIEADSMSIAQPNLITGNSGAILTTTTNQGNAGNINLNVRDQLSVETGIISSDVLTLGDQSAIGQGGNIRIKAGSVQFINNSLLSSSASGQGSAGTISIDAQDRVSINQSLISTSTASNPGQGLIVQGQGGEIQIAARSVFVTNQGQIVSFTDGVGSGGNISIRAVDRVVIDGTASTESTGISSAVDVNGTGRGGTVQIATGSLVLQDGVITTGTSGRGDAGNIVIQASNGINLQGDRAKQTQSRIAAGTTQRSAGNSGGIQIATPGILRIQDAKVSVSSLGTGKSANLDVTAGTVSLDRGLLLAETAIGTGGNIQLQVRDLLLLRQGSLISTTAGTDQAGGDGGNISINAATIVAPTLENSQIRANAFSGRGGTVRIVTDGIFGIQAGTQRASESSITASSQLGVQGTVSIVQPEVQPIQSVIELPTTILDASNQLTQLCPRNPQLAKAGSFVVSGTGSLPPNPMIPLTGTIVTRPLAMLDTLPSNHAIASAVPKALPPAIVEAQGWIKTPDGKVTLVAHTRETMPATIAACPTAIH